MAMRLGIPASVAGGDLPVRCGHRVGADPLSRRNGGTWAVFASFMISGVFHTMGVVSGRRVGRRSHSSPKALKGYDELSCDQKLDTVPASCKSADGGEHAESPAARAKEIPYVARERQRPQSLLRVLIEARILLPGVSGGPHRPVARKERVMSRFSRCAALVLCASAVSLTLAAAADAQGRGVRRSPPPPERTVVVRGQVFIGGYFYDPFFGPYPWWPRTAYPHWYFPVYDRRADLRISMTPEEAAVYVDGFYAGVVDDFDGVFEGLPLPPGGHNIVLYLEGYRTSRHNIYLRPAATFKLRGTLEKLPAGEISEPPPVAPPVPPPPAGSYRTPRTSPPVSGPAQPAVQGAAPLQAVGFGTLDVRVQPATAEVTIDGQRWVSSDEGHFVVQVPAGMHRIEVTKRGYQRFSTEIEVRDSETMPLNVSLMTAIP